MISADAALKKLKEGNARFVSEHELDHDLSKDHLISLHENGQSPFATIISCSDSRVVPEHIFHVGLGELFVIRTAGNVIGGVELESALYACDHLDTNLLLVLGHTHCGAVAAALDAGHHELSHLVDPIRRAIGETTDPIKATWLNMEAGMNALMRDSRVQDLCAHHDLKVCGAVYDIETGIVQFEATETEKQG